MTAIVLSEGVCDFCQSDTSILSCDVLYRVEDITAHYFCLLFSSGLGQRGEDCDGIKGFLPVDIRRELRRGSRLKCVFCKKKGATVGCAEAACKKTYHLNCGAKHDCLMQFFNQFKSFCSRHRGVGSSRPRRNSSNVNCTICQQKLGAGRKIDLSIVYASCCDGGFHKDCVQSMSLSAGFQHFRCPNCNDTEKFVPCMQQSGIYIPEQDASWEREGGGDVYEDLESETIRVCHAKLCFCPHENGRAYHSEDGLWEILKCDACGYKGIHAKCGGLENVPEAVWHCYTCRKAMRQQGQEEVILTETNKLWDKQMSATIKTIPGLAEKLKSQGLKQKPPLLAKYDYSTSFTDLLGSLLDRDDSPGDSDYESGDKNSNKCVKVDL